MTVVSLRLLHDKLWADLSKASKTTSELIESCAASAATPTLLFMYVLIDIFDYR